MSGFFGPPGGLVFPVEMFSVVMFFFGYFFFLPGTFFRFYELIPTFRPENTAITPLPVIQLLRQTVGRQTDEGQVGFPESARVLFSEFHTFGMGLPFPRGAPSVFDLAHWAFPPPIVVVVGWAPPVFLRFDFFSTCSSIPGGLVDFMTCNPQIPSFFLCLSFFTIKGAFLHISSGRCLYSPPLPRLRPFFFWWIEPSVSVKRFFFILWDFSLHPPSLYAAEAWSLPGGIRLFTKHRLPFSLMDHFIEAPSSLSAFDF